MIKKLFAARGFMSVLMIMALVVAATVGLRITSPKPEMQTYCAQLPDSVGLFVGSDVTIMGLPVGQVTNVRPNGTEAHVEFEIPAERKLPLDVGATTMSETLIADRKLALIGAEPSGPGLDSGQCITKTLTPKSFSQTFHALGNLAEQLNSAEDGSQRGVVDPALTALHGTTADTGDQINAIIRNLAVALDSPDVAIGNIGQLIEAVNGLAQSANSGWAHIESMFPRLANGLNIINEGVMPPVIDLVGNFDKVLPPLNDITIMYGGPLLRQAEANPDLAQQISVGIGSLREIINMAPAVAGAFSDAVDPDSGRLSVGYAPPNVAVPEQHASEVCAALNIMSPGTCAGTSDGLVNIPLNQVIFGTVGAR